MKNSATIEDMYCPCGYKFLSDNTKFFRRINKKSVRVCSSCYKKKNLETVDIPVKGDIVVDKLLGNVVKFRE